MPERDPVDPERHADRAEDGDADRAADGDAGEGEGAISGDVLHGGAGDPLGGGVAELEPADEVSEGIPKQADD